MLQFKLSFLDNIILNFILAKHTWTHYYKVKCLPTPVGQ